MVAEKYGKRGIRPSLAFCVASYFRFARFNTFPQYYLSSQATPAAKSVEKRMFSQARTALVEYFTLLFFMKFYSSMK